MTAAALVITAGAAITVNTRNGLSPMRPSLQRRERDVAERDRGPLRLQRDFALLQFASLALVHLHAVDRQRDRVALADDLVLVPLAQVLLDLLVLVDPEVMPLDLRVLPLLVHA